MNDMERRKFEDSFQEAFKNAEVTPSENVWTNIELDLERADGDKMKRRLFFFKTLAAASIVFAMSIAGVGYYVLQNSDRGHVAQKTAESYGNSEGDELKNELNASSSENNNSSTTGKNGSVDKGAETQSADDLPVTRHQQSNDHAPGSSALKESNNLASSTNGGLAEDEKQASVARAEERKSIAKSATPFSAGQKSNTDKTDKITPGKGANDGLNNATSPGFNAAPLNENGKTAFNGMEPETARKLPAFYTPADPELKLPTSTADPGMLLLARLAEEEKRYAAEEKNSKESKTENLWTSVGFAAGAFSANNPRVDPVASNTMYLNSSSTASKQSKASGLSYSVGVSVGTQLSNRWTLQGGINYMTQSSDYTANSVLLVDNNFSSPKAESINAFAPQTLDATANTKVAQTFPYNVNNNVRFVSVPVQAGYLLVNKKFGLQLNAGVSTDLFLQNTITPEGGSLSSTTQSRGDDSPYRSLNFSGLMGTEFSYKLGHRYRLSVNPGLRYPFSSLYKSNTGVDSTPLTFDVGLRFKYIFH
jgi:hypothetical protein